MIGQIAQFGLSFIKVFYYSAQLLRVPKICKLHRALAILYYSPAPKSANIVVQSVLTRRDAKHHHVAIALYNHSLIHAMPKLGIHLRPLVEYLNENKDFVVFRHTASLSEINSEYLENI